MPRRANCASCGVPIQLGGGSLPPGQATCRACRKIDRLPFDASKCGTPRGRDQHRHRGETPCEPCRSAWNQVSNERRKKMLADGWVRPDREPSKMTFRSDNCSECAAPLARAALADPLCATCRGNRPGYNIPISRADRLAIYDRDGWICQLCNNPVDPSVDPRTRWGTTLDHVTPRSLGGSHDALNLRLAHRRCNSVRGTRSDEFSTALVTPANRALIAALATR